MQKQFYVFKLVKYVFNILANCDTAKQMFCAIITLIAKTIIRTPILF